jgi:hypothetical protein
MLIDQAKKRTQTTLVNEFFAAKDSNAGAVAEGNTLTQTKLTNYNTKT